MGQRSDCERRESRRARLGALRLAALLVAFLIVPAVVYAAVSFLNATNYTTGRRPLNVARADVDQDGDEDVLVAEAWGPTVSLMKNNGRGQFFRSSIYQSDGTPVWVVSGRLNSDYYPDMVVANESANYVAVRLNDKKGGFGGATKYAVGTPTTIALNDMDRDGDLDLLVTNQKNNAIALFRGDGTGKFGARREFPVGATPRAIAVADYNADGRPDIATVNYYGDSVSILVASGDGYRRLDYNVGLRPFDVDAADVNRDGASDLVVTNHLSNSLIVLLNQGGAEFGYGATIPTPSQPTNTSLTDLDGDGRVDACVASYAQSNLVTMFGDGMGGFSADGTFEVGKGPWSAVSADIDGDRKADIVTANRDGDNISVLRSNTSAIGTKTELRASAGTIDYGRPCTLSIRLVDDGASTVPSSPVVVERKTSQGWTKVADVKTSNAGLARLTVSPGQTTTYRARFLGGAAFRSSTSPYVTVRVRAWMSTPATPSSVTRYRGFTTYGYLKPRHSSGGKSVKLLFYRYESGKWVLRKAVYAVNRNYSSYTKYTQSTSLSRRGSWRVRAYHSDSSHSAKYSGYRYFKVR